MTNPGLRMTADRTGRPEQMSKRFRHWSFVIRHLFPLAALILLLPGCTSSATTHPDAAAIRAFLTRYFATWSARDMDGYASCFDPQARILFLSQSGQLESEGLTDFLHGQRLAHETASVPMSEKPTAMTIQGDAKVAQAAVTWVLTKGSAEERGTDFFTLKHEGDGWKIVTLVFYGE
jgi:hypothetical protein